MNIVYLISIILGLSFQNIAKKMYSEKNGSGGVYTFSMLSTLTAVMFFIVTAKGFEWNNGFLLGICSVIFLNL